MQNLNNNDMPFHQNTSLPDPQSNAHAGQDSNQQASSPQPGQFAWNTNSPAPSSASAINRKIWLPLLILIAGIFGIGLLAGWQFGSKGVAGLSSPTNGSTRSITNTMREKVIARVRPAVVQVNVSGPTSNSLGSGVIIDKRGYIITNNHVVENSTSIEVVLFDGDILPAQMVGRAPDDDLAVVKVDASKTNLTVATLGDSSKVQVGEDVLAIGNPLGITQTVTSGIISALNRNVATGDGGSILPGTIQTDAAINPGNSGGALVDLQGNLIGIPTLTAIDPQFRTPANGVGFAIPSNRVNFIAPQLISAGKVTRTGRAELAIQAEDVDAEVAAQNHLPVTQGAYIVSVKPGGAADKAGLMSGDVITQVNNQPVTGVLPLGDLLITKNPGDKVSVQVYRGNERLTVNVTLGELPAR